MKKIIIFLLAIVSASCNGHQRRHAPIIFDSLYRNTYGCDLIIGSDTLLVDSVYKRYFGYYADSFQAYYYVRKQYVSTDLEKIINKYILAHCSHWKCDSVRPWGNYHFKFTSYDNWGNLIQSCLTTKNELEDKKAAMNFYQGLKITIEKSSYNNKQSKTFLRDLKRLIDKGGFPISPEQKKIFLRKFINEQLTPEQKRLLKNVIDLDEIEFVDSSKKNTG